jgi:hypothetical protein
MASYIILPENTPLQNLKKYVVYVGEDSIQDTYWSGSSTKPHIFVTVTATASVVTQWLSTMLHRHRQNLSAHNHVVGLGVQWSNPDNNPNLSTADTLQLCIDNECLIFQLTHADQLPENLRKFLRHPHNTFVGFLNNGDRWRLSRSVYCLELYRWYLMDLRYKAKKICNEDLSLATLDEIALKCLGFEVEQSREIGMSNWGENLDSDQIAYASIDAYCSYLMGVSIQSWKYKDD